MLQLTGYSPQNKTGFYIMAAAVINTIHNLYSGIPVLMQI